MKEHFDYKANSNIFLINDNTERKPFDEYLYVIIILSLYKKTEIFRTT